MALDEIVDGGVQGVDAAVDAASDLALGEQGEEPLDLVEPGRTGRGQVHMPTRPFSQPFSDQGGLVRGVIVHDEMDVESTRHGSLDLVEELAELGSTVASIALADDPPCWDVEGGKQRGDAIALVVVTRCAA